MTENDEIVQLSGVSHAFDGHGVLHDVDLSIRNRELITILGPSGCGKTTLLRIIAGFESPTRGTVTIAGKPVNGVPPNHRRVNTVFQSYALFPHMTVSANVAFGLRMSRVAGPDIQRRVTDMLRLVKLEALADRKPHQLSGGQQQRVAIARAAVNQPLVLLLDEPLSALDAKLRKEMQRELKALQRKLAITFVLVTHDQQEALAMSDRLVVMNEGRIEQVGTPVEIYENPNSLRVARFVGETNVFTAVVTGSGGGTLTARLEGIDRFCRLSSRLALGPGRAVKVVLRPEDLLVARQPPEGDHAIPWFEGVVEEIIYKGTTYDMGVRLVGGQAVMVTEFFDEDDEQMIATTGERIFVSWVAGWEVVFPDDEQEPL